MPIANAPFATTPFSTLDVTIVAVSGNQLTIQEGFTQENTGATGNVQVGGQAMTLTLGQETGRIAPGNLDQQLNLSVNWSEQALLVCNSHIDVVGQQLTAGVGSVTIDAQQVQQVTGFENTLSSQPVEEDYTVTVVNYGAGNRFVLNGVSNPALNIFRATKLVFDQSAATNDGHPLAFKATGTGETVNYTVTFQNIGGANKYFIDGVQQPNLELVEGNTYVFNWSAASGHPFRFSTTSDGTHAGGSEYTTGVTFDGVNYITTITVGAGTPDLYYYCQIHSGMGAAASTPTEGPFYRGVSYLLNGSSATRGQYYDVATFNAGRATGSRKVILQTDKFTPSSFRYYCTVHGNGMGNTIAAANYVTISGVAIANTTGQELTLTSPSLEPVIAKIFTATGNQIALSQGSVEITINQSRLVDGFLLNANTSNVSVFSGWDNVPNVPDIGNWVNTDPGSGSTWTNINATTSGTWTEVNTGTTPTWTNVTVPTDGNWTET